jgi:hypothetical protein
MTIQLVFVSDAVSDDGEDRINNAPCVPNVGSRIDTIWGIRVVQSLYYDFHADNGECRVLITVSKY